MPKIGHKQMKGTQTCENQRKVAASNPLAMPRWSRIEEGKKSETE